MNAQEHEPEPADSFTCTKRPYESERDAKQAHSRAGFRYRVYWCEEHGGYHVTAAEKR